MRDSASVAYQIYFDKTLPEKEKWDSFNHHLLYNAYPVEQLVIGDELIGYASECNDEQWVFRGYYCKGNAYIALGEIDKACDSYLESLASIEKDTNNISIGDAYFGLGNAFSLVGNSSKAVEYYLKAKDVYMKKADTNYIAYAVINIISAYNKQNNIDSVEVYIEYLNNFLTKKDNYLFVGYRNAYLAFAMAKRQNFKQAVEVFEEAIACFKTEFRFYDLLSVKIEFSEILFQQEQYNLAQQYALESYNGAVEAGLKEQIRDAAKLLSDIYENKGDFKKSYNYLKTFLAYKDSISNNEVVSKMADLRAEYEISQKQVEVDLLRKKRTISRISLFAVLSVTILLFVVAYILFCNNRYKKRLNGLLNKHRRRVIEQNRELEEINASKDKMFSIVSHDLRGPIHSLAGMSTFMKEMVQENRIDDLMKTFDVMYISMSNVTGLLDNLLEWSGSRIKSVPYNPELLDLKDIIAEQFDVFNYSANGKSISLLNGIDESCMAYVDKNTIATVFRNLINNAVKFTPENGAVYVGSQKEEDKVVIKVSDTGVGISDERLRKIFDFNKTESTFGTKREKGIGLGLRLAHEFVQLNMSEIWVESSEGKGTTFYVRMPQKSLSEKGGTEKS